MITTQFKQYSLAHQFLLDADLNPIEVINLTQTDNSIHIFYSNEDSELNKHPVDKAQFVQQMRSNVGAIHINCEYRQGFQQHVLVSQKMANSLGLKAYKEFTTIALCQDTFDYRKCVLLANAVKYRPIVEQKAIIHSWKVYEQIQNFKMYRCKAFHTRYSEQFNKERKTIAELEQNVTSAYENLNFIALDTTMQRLEAIRRVLPLNFTFAVERVYLEIIRNWLLVNAKIPFEMLPRTVHYINSSEMSPTSLKVDSTWRDVKNALDWFV